MFLFGEEEDFGVSLAFFVIGNILYFFKFENQESFSPKFQFLYKSLYGIVYTDVALPKMRNPPIPKITTFPPEKHTFLATQKCAYYELAQYFI